MISSASGTADTPRAHITNMAALGVFYFKKALKDVSNKFPCRVFAGYRIGQGIVQVILPGKSYGPHSMVS